MGLVEIMPVCVCVCGRFAAEVFHGVQEEVAIMSSRSRKLMGRVQRIEASLSPLEKAVLAQKSHLHFAYTAGMVEIQASLFSYSDVCFPLSASACSCSNISSSNLELRRLLLFLLNILHLLNL